MADAGFAAAGLLGLLLVLALAAILVSAPAESLTVAPLTVVFFATGFGAGFASGRSSWAASSLVAMGGSKIAFAAVSASATGGGSGLGEVCRSVSV